MLITPEMHAVNTGLFNAVEVRILTTPELLVTPVRVSLKLPENCTVTVAPTTGAPRSLVTVTVATPYKVPFGPLAVEVVSEANVLVAVGGGGGLSDPSPVICK